jgi:hypothetical protein
MFLFLIFFASRIDKFNIFNILGLIKIAARGRLISPLRKVNLI